MFFDDSSCCFVSCWLRNCFVLSLAPSFVLSNQCVLVAGDDAACLLMPGVFVQMVCARLRRQMMADASGCVGQSSDARLALVAVPFGQIIQCLVLVSTWPSTEQAWKHA